VIGYIFDIDRKVVYKIPNVLKCNTTTLLGDNKIPNSNIIAIVGTGQYIITDQVFNEGDILPNEITDRRSEIPVLTE
jgi:hypothetical protein